MQSNAAALLKRIRTLRYGAQLCAQMAPQPGLERRTCGL